MLRVASAGYLFLIRAASVMLQLRLIQIWFGPSYAGLNALLNQITFYVLLAELGLASAATSLLFKPILEGDFKRTVSLVLALRAITRRIVVFMTVFGSVGLTIFCRCLHTEVPFRILWLASMLSGASALVTLLALPYQCYLNGCDRIPARNIILGTGFLFKTALGLFLASFFHSYIAVVLVLPLVAFAELLAQVRVSKLNLLTHSISSDAIAIATKDIRSIAKFVLFHRIGGLFYFQSDYIILTFSAGLILVSQYAQFQYLISGALSLFATFTYTFLAKLARYRLALDPGQQVPLYRRSVFAFSAAAAVSAMLFFVISLRIVPVLYGRSSLSTKTVALLAILLMLNLFKSNDDLWIDSSGAYSIGYYLPVCEALFYVSTGLILVRYYKIDGIIAAGIITNIIFSVALKSYIVAHGVLKDSTARVFAVKFAAVGSVMIVTVPLVIFFGNYFRLPAR